MGDYQKRFRSRRLFAVRLASVAAIACLAPVKAHGDAPNSWRVGFLTNYSPFSYLIANKQLRGFDVEVVSALAEREGMRLEAIPGTMAKLQQLLKAGEIDFIGNQLLVSPDNRRLFDFARPFAVNQLVCAQHEDDHRDFLSLDDLFGLKVGVLANTGVEDQVLGAIGRKSTVSVPFIHDALHLLADKKLDAVLEESLIIDYHIEREQMPIKTTAPFAPPLRIGLALPKGASALQLQLNQAITNLVRDPAFEKISTSWFGYDVSRMRASPAISEG